ncbi:MAG: hypothetical protein AAGE52_03150 [Myxococcota bacterium]
MSALQTIRLWRAKRVPRSRIRRNFKAGRAGEARAETTLRAAGFRIVARQARVRWRFWVDDTAQVTTLTADFLVRRQGRRFVADAKTGQAARLTAATRRQLLEYSLAFDVDGVLLVDADNGRIRHVEFSSRRPPRVWPFLVVALGVALVVVAAAFALR